MYCNRKVLNDQVCLKLTRKCEGVALNAFELPKVRKDDDICDVRVLWEIHTNILQRSYRLIVEKSNGQVLSSCNMISLSLKAFETLAKNYRTVTPK